jgi:hypothetical protein
MSAVGNRVSFFLSSFTKLAIRSNGCLLSFSMTFCGTKYKQVSANNKAKIKGVVCFFCFVFFAFFSLERHR